MKEKLPSFSDVIKQTHGLEKYLLLGNGFSTAWDREIFGYKSLKDNAKGFSDAVKKIFAALDTSDFEQVINAFDYSSVVCNALAIKNDFKSLADEVRNTLITTIAASHPDIPSRISPDQFNACIHFLGFFKKIYTLNYDMLLYWVLIRDMFREDGEKPILKKMGDGFAYNDEEFLNWDGISFEVHYLHGALHLFEHSDLLKLNWKKTNKPLKEQFVHLIKEKKQLPLFVSEGVSSKKLEKIRKSGYLTRCLNSLQKIGSAKKSSAIFTFGVSFSDNDDHILQSISRNNCDQIFVSIFGSPDDSRNKRTIAKVNSLKTLKSHRRHGQKIGINFFDAETAGVWSFS